MSENKGFFGDFNEIVHIWARIQAFSQVFRLTGFCETAK